MIDFSKLDRSRQKSVIVDGIEYEIQTGFCFGINFENMHNAWRKEGKEAVDLGELNVFYKSLVPENKLAGYEELCKFYRNDQPLPNPTGKQSNVRGMDWLLDSEYILAAFRQQYMINLLIDDLHWHDFMSLYNGLIGTKINDIVSARYSKPEGKFDPMKEMRRAWELPLFEIDKPIFDMK